MSENRVKVVDVWKNYGGGKYILQGINFEARPREMVLIRGRSGSGKTTLLSLLGCMDTPSKGDIYLNGYDVAKLKQRELAEIRLRKIGFVFQSHNLIEDLTVEENVLLPMKIAGSHDGMARVRELLRQFDILPLAKKRPNEISGGERQRAAVARALANNPSILLADEPTASLDLDNCEIVVDAFKVANRRFGATVIIASHDPMLEEPIKRWYRLRAGKLTEE